MRISTRIRLAIPVGVIVVAIQGCGIMPSGAPDATKQQVLLAKAETGFHTLYQEPLLKDRIELLSGPSVKEVLSGFQGKPLPCNIKAYLDARPTPTAVRLTNAVRDAKRFGGELLFFSPLDDGFVATGCRSQYVPVFLENTGCTLEECSGYDVVQTTPGCIPSCFCKTSCTSTWCKVCPSASGTAPQALAAIGARCMAGLSPSADHSDRGNVLGVAPSLLRSPFVMPGRQISFKGG